MAGENSSFFIARWDQAVSSVDDDPLSANPFNLRLQGPNPNPGSAMLAFALATPTRINLAIYDLQGRLVETLMDQTLAGGEYTARWDPGSSAKVVAGGVYYARLRGDNDISSTQKVLVIR